MFILGEEEREEERKKRGTYGLRKHRTCVCMCVCFVVIYFGDLQKNLSLLKFWIIIYLIFVI